MVLARQAQAAAASVAMCQVVDVADTEADVTKDASESLKRSIIDDEVGREHKRPRDDL